jgi:putative hydroxymethylpyrimidine transport system substrate-binding protein
VSRVRLLAGIMLVGLLAASSGCGSPSSAAGGGTPQPVRQVSLVLDWLLNSDHGGLELAIHDGTFRRHHLDLHPYVPSDTTAQVTLVGAGKADFGITYETDLLAARAQHIPVRSVMCLVQHPLNTVMALRRSGIRRPRDLAGKTVGMAGSPSDIPIVSAMVRHDGATMQKVKMVNVGYNLLPVLLAGKVDAVVGVYWTWEAIQARLRGYPVNVMRVERWGVPNYCELVLIANQHTIQSRPGLVRDTVHALQSGYARAATDPQAAWNALHAASHSLHRNLVLRSLRLLGPIVTAARTVGYQAPTQWVRYERWLAAHHLIAQAVDAHRAFTNRFLAANRR